MNITLLGHHDIASLYALNRVIGLLPEHKHSVLLSGNTGLQAVVDKRLAALARVDAKLCDRFLCGEVCGPIARQLASPQRETFDDPNCARGRRLLTDLEPDLILSIRYRRILREEAIAVPRLGVLNLHSGILPDYRGVMATFWAMLDGADEIGTTLHWIVDSGIDTGPVVSVRRQTVRPQRSYLANVLGLYPQGCESMADAVRKLASGRRLPFQEQRSKGRYFHAPQAGDVQRFESKGLVLCDGREDRLIRPEP